MFENPRRGRQARNFTTNVLKILDLKSPSEQIFSENCRWVPLIRPSFILIFLERGIWWLHMYRTNSAVIVPKAFSASHDQCIILIEIFTKTGARDFIFVMNQCAFRIATFCFLAFSLTPSSSFTALFFTQNYFQKLFHPSSLSLSLPP